MNRNTLIAVGVFAALALAFVATREKEVSVGIKKFEAPKLKADAITSIEVSGAMTAKLTKENDVWVVSDPAKPEKKFAVDEGAVKSAVEAIADFTAPDFVTEKQEKQAELEVDATKGLTVKVNGNALALVIGKAAKAGGAYVRLASSPQIFSTTSSLTYFIRKDVNGWRKRSIATAKSEDITKLKVTHVDGTSVELVGEGSEWKLGSAAPAGFRFDVNTARQVINQFATMTAQSFSDGETDEALGLNTPTVVEAELKDGKKVKASFGSARPDSSRPLRIDGDAQVYLVPAYLFEGIAKHVDGLRDLSVMAFDASKVTKVEVQAGVKKAVVTKDGSSWKLVEPKTPPAGFEFDASQVAVQLERLKGVRASRVVEGAKSVGKTSALVELTLEGGAKQQLVFGDAAAVDGGTPEVLLKGSADALVYAASTGLRTAYEAGHELFKKPPPPPDWSNARGLDQLPPEIRKQLEAQMRMQQPH